MQPSDALLAFYSGEGPERVGFVMADGSVVEVENVAPEPAKTFAVDPMVMVRMEREGAVATWHTHPGESGNLSLEDWRCFHNWPEFTHYIVGDDGVWMFRVDEAGKVLRS